ncbi:uncharacterized protein HMPREF1541_09523 [Cyphellophora europaea CBS 101466]|uniref:Uncharacterized protein n=1 Tax=Cyphellophora europaea (strain CBS 101466) TaxID=1220924 RepID=W2SAN0_CYPE1|nr:uncharacterized protein HMPREF1541_09523 [Cyphellophora europaea CBS 101466]ETN45690.1 hypothetical protein HMPREF1541_09523 [Cyphellophora europaea CBS 101466]
MSSPIRSGEVLEHNNLPIPSEIREAIWKQALKGSIAYARLPTGESRSVHEIQSPLAPLYVSRATRKDILPLILPAVAFDLRLTPSTLDKLSRKGTWPSLQRAEQVIIHSVAHANELHKSLGTILPELKKLTFVWPVANNTAETISAIMGEPNQEHRINGIYAVIQQQLLDFDEHKRRTDALASCTKLGGFKLILRLPLSEDLTIVLEDHLGAQEATLETVDGSTVVELPEEWEFQVWQFSEKFLEVNKQVQSIVRALRYTRLTRSVLAQRFEVQVMWAMENQDMLREARRNRRSRE